MTWTAEEVDEVLEGLEGIITEAHREGSMTSRDPVVCVMRCDDGEFYVTHRDRRKFLDDLDPDSEMVERLVELPRTHPSLIPYWCVLVDQPTESVVCVTEMTRVVMTGMGSSARN